jgi:hypothetical protein
VRHGAHRLGILGDGLALPLGSEKISVRFELLRIDELCIVGVFAAVHVALKNKDVFSLEIGIMVLAIPPFDSSKTSASRSAGFIGSRIRESCPIVAVTSLS